MMCLNRAGWKSWDINRKFINPRCYKIVFKNNASPTKQTRIKSSLFGN